MKYGLKVLGAGLIACAAFAEEPAVKEDSGAISSDATNQPELTQSATAKEVGAFNKATSVIGMAVKDSSGKDLGKVCELVFDLDSQRLSYALVELSSGGSARLVPIPVTALKPAKDHFSLNMSPAVLAAASSVASDEWPALDAFAVGGPAQAEKGKGSSTESEE